MIEKYTVILLSFVLVILQSNADDKDDYYVVDGQVPNYFNFNGIRAAQKPNTFKNLYQIMSNQEQRVKIQLYYECLCPDCRSFDTGEFKDTVLALGSYLDINVYPYGNAETKEHDGHVEFTCQHGPPECYGNKLHACAIDHFNNITAAVLYNSCMMDSSQAGRGSDDSAADVCAQAIGIDSGPIKQCATGERGTVLLKYYGVESEKANFMSVPHILIDGVENNGDNFKKDVCKAFSNPPPACNGLL